MSVKVGIVGMLGNLGSRLTMALSRDPQFEVALGVVQPDDNLTRAISALGTSPGLRQIAWAKKMFLAAKHSQVEKWNSAQSLIEFQPVDQLSLGKECDAIIDVTNCGSRELLEQYRSFAGPVILQSGAKEGHLISPPLVTLSGSNLYRQGDCLVSALVPVLSAFNQNGFKLLKARMHLIKQYGERLGDYPTNQRLSATYLCPAAAEFLQAELTGLMPEVEAEVEGIYQIPGLVDYTATLNLELNREISGLELHRRLSGLPRLMVAGEHIASTYEIDYYLRSRLQMSGIGLPPIVVYGSTLKPKKDSRSNRVFLQLAIYYKLIAVLPNIDALRILCLGEEPLTAMRNTDELAKQLPV
jgi:hypothetical protein